MKRLLGCFALLVLSLFLPGVGESQPRAGYPPPEEIATNWIHLFDGETTFGWYSPNISRWSVVKGMLYPQADRPGLLVTTSAFADYDLAVVYHNDDKTDQWIYLGCDAEGRKNTGFPFLLSLLPGSGRTECIFQVRGGQLQLISYLQPGMRGFSHLDSNHLGIKIRGSCRGHIGLAGNGVVFRKIKLRPITPEALFNGKDLTGWKEHPGKKSQFLVTAPGCLTIKGGPGALQTEGSWRDFVLQLDCRTNTKNANSGVFLRCRPGEYQQGYEVQIHNGFLEKSMKDYTLKDYDLHTGDVQLEQKVQSPASNYGTGAICGHVPVRRAASRDGDWFTMTIIAKGRHFATWVNGVQTVDWTDNRWVEENARKGCRLGAGSISLQGSDESTDVTFRNIRLANLSPVKE